MIVIWELILYFYEFLLIVIGCVFILGNLASSKFIVGCLMVHGAVLESMVWCTILVLILISLRRSLILKLKGLIFFWLF